MDPLYEKVNYSSMVNFIFSRYIYEYDIQKANISILYDKGIISYEDYTQLYNADKLHRQVYIGNLQKKDKRITNALQNGIIEAKRNLFIQNNIEPDEVLSIKNDAVFIIGRKLTHTDFGTVHFIEKHEYTSFIRLLNIEIYYGYNRIKNDETFSIKGLGKNEVYHRDYMIDFILYVLNSIQMRDIKSVIVDVVDFYYNYINRNLRIGYYREFNSMSKYRIGEFLVDDLDDTVNNKYSINISYNTRILTELFKCIGSVYMSR